VLFSFEKNIPAFLTFGAEIYSERQKKKDRFHKPAAMQMKVKRRSAFVTITDGCGLENGR